MIAAVGTAAELGEGTRFPEAAIVPGLVNAHTHLEYAVYAGFGDGLSFAPWLATHIERKARIGWDEFVAIAIENFAEAAAEWLTGDAPFTAKLHPEYAPYGDYDQLMRLEEWYGRE